MTVRSLGAPLKSLAVIIPPTTNKLPTTHSFLTLFPALELVCVFLLSVISGPLHLPRALSSCRHLRSVSDRGTSAVTRCCFDKALHPPLPPHTALPIYNLNAASLPIDNRWHKTHVGTLCNMISLSYLT